ncbi:peptidylprolyl isomerase [Sphingobacterium sp. IITKGP-BTPF85]|uniref:peptidylprolyl isomerase n=1 Tax=Sphingobacterium sp. IITKGP-BTPF85 TaxID=1338009 RepID=UPI002934534E|nr:peptidylprolyl isomerase [Sphingobacterium sp. IITKGP-BTPF85]
MDGNYTVFGELVNGTEVIDAIAAVKTDKNDRPLTDERMYVKLLTKREAINLERELKGLKPQNGFFTKIADLFSSQNY